MSAATEGFSAMMSVLDKGSMGWRGSTATREAGAKGRRY